jgi:AraC family transcriptional regulator, arabinose operon regulatory protein
MAARPPICLTRSCPQAPGSERLPLRCIMAGHWLSRHQPLRSRLIDEAVVIQCIAGGGWMHLAGRRHAVRPGQLFVCPAGVEHGYGCDPDSGWEILWFHAAGSHVEDLCRAAGFSAQQPVSPLRDPQEIAARMQALLDALDMNPGLAPWEASVSLHRFFVSLVRSAGERREEDLTRLADWRTESLDELVRRSGYSKYHFCRLFKAQTHRTPWQYVLERKVERGRELLLGSRLTVKEIASVLGFANPDYFARLFRSHTGVVPSRYRGA